MSDNALNLNAGFDRSLVWRHGGSVRYLVVEIASGSATAEPAPLNLGLAIDVSSSMSGEKVETAKRAAIGIINGLTASDQLCVSTFASQGARILESTRMDDEGKAKAIESVEKLQANGNTNLSEGWFIAAEDVAGAVQPNSVNRVIILTDGQTNAGVTDSADLAKHAANLRIGGITASTVGIGDDYVASLLQAIASDGGGQMHDAEHAHEIVEVLLGELNELKNLVLENIAVEVRYPEGAKVECLSAMPSDAAQGLARIFAGSMGADSRREVVLRVMTPKGEAGDPIPFLVKTTAKVVGSSGAIERLSHPHLRFARGLHNNAQPRDERLAEIVLRVWHAFVIRFVSGLNRLRDWRQATAYLDRAIPYYEKYARGLTGGPEKIRELMVLREKAGQDWNERSRKEMELRAYKTSRTEIDYRSIKRTGFADRL